MNTKVSLLLVAVATAFFAMGLTAADGPFQTPLKAPQSKPAGNQ